MGRLNMWCELVLGFLLARYLCGMIPMCASTKAHGWSVEFYSIEGNF